MITLRVRNSTYQTEWPTKQAARTHAASILGIDRDQLVGVMLSSGVTVCGSANGGLDVNLTCGLVEYWGADEVETAPYSQVEVDEWW